MPYLLLGKDKKSRDRYHLQAINSIDMVSDQAGIQLIAIVCSVAIL
jgi:hypothetical protein